MTEQMRPEKLHPWAKPEPQPGRSPWLCAICGKHEAHAVHHAPARGESVSPVGLNKAQRAAYTVACPTCGAKVGLPCRDNDKLRIAWGRYVPHHERYVEARKHGQTGRRGDPQYKAR